MPNFLVIGAQKSGTTSLCTVLSRHSDVFMSKPKEPHFFSVDELYDQGLDYYATLFENAAGKSAIGEGSTSYTMQAHRPHAAERVARHLPNARLIYIVRHPMRRLESGYMHLKATGRTHASFEEAIGHFPHLIDTSLYWKQLTVYRSHFPDHQIRVVTFEDFVHQPEQVVKELFKFLDVDPDQFNPQWLQKCNVSKGKRFEKALLARARSHPFYDSVSRFVPSWIKRPIKHALTDSIHERTSLAPAKYTEILKQVKNDSQQILLYCGKPPSFWNLSS